VNRTILDVETEAVDQIKQCVHKLVLLVQLKDHLDVKSDLVKLVLKTVQPRRDVITNIHQDVQKLVNVQKIN